MFRKPAALRSVMVGSAAHIRNAAHVLGHLIDGRLGCFRLLATLVIAMIFFVAVPGFVHHVFDHGHRTAGAAHRNPATRHRRIAVEDAAGNLVLLTVISGEDRVDVLWPAAAFQQLVDHQAAGPMESRTGLGHQRQVRGPRRVIRREKIRRPRRAGIARLAFFIGDLVQSRDRLDLLFREARAVGTAKVAEGQVLQAMTGAADLVIDLKAALQLVLVKGAERPLEAEADVLDLWLSPPAARCRARDRDCGRDQDGKDACLDHLSLSPRSHSAGVALGFGG